MDNHQASLLAGTLAGHTEAIRFHLPEQARAMTDAAQRMEWAVQEFTRQVDRMEDLMRNPPTPGGCDE